MRFFTNDRDQHQRDAEQEHPEKVQSEPVPVPQQRPASPWAQGPRHSSDDPGQDPAAPTGRQDPDRSDDDPADDDRPAVAHHPDVEVTPLFGRPPHARGGGWDEARGTALQEPALGDRRPDDDEGTDDVPRSDQALLDRVRETDRRPGQQQETGQPSGLTGHDPADTGRRPFGDDQAEQGSGPGDRLTADDPGARHPGTGPGTPAGTDADRSDTGRDDVGRSDTDQAGTDQAGTGRTGVLTGAHPADAGQPDAERTGRGTDRDDTRTEPKDTDLRDTDLRDTDLHDEDRDGTDRDGFDRTGLRDERPDAAGWVTDPDRPGTPAGATAVTGAQDQDQDRDAARDADRDPNRDGLPAAGPLNGQDRPAGLGGAAPITLDAEGDRAAAGRTGPGERGPDDGGLPTAAPLAAGAVGAARGAEGGRTPDELDGGTFEDPVAVEPGADARTFAPTTAAANGQLPGSVPEQTVGPLFGDADAHGFRDRWREVQLQFVDDPKGAAAQAATLVDEAVDALTSNLKTQRAALGKTSDGDTEQLRMRIRAYRDFLDRLLAL